jgi:hypothetical protein
VNAVGEMKGRDTKKRKEKRRGREEEENDTS